MPLVDWRYIALRVWTDIPFTLSVRAEYDEFGDADVATARVEGTVLHDGGTGSVPLGECCI